MTLIKIRIFRKNGIFDPRCTNLEETAKRWEQFKKQQKLYIWLLPVSLPMGIGIYLDNLNIIIGSIIPLLILVGFSIKDGVLRCPRCGSDKSWLPYYPVIKKCHRCDLKIYEKFSEFPEIPK